MQSLEDFKRFQERDWASVPDSRVTLRHLIAEGDFVAVYALYEGTQTGAWGPFPPSGKRMEIEFSGIFRIEDGRIVELWVTWDNLAALMQLGHLQFPEPN